MPKFMMICRDRQDIESTAERGKLRPLHDQVVRPLWKSRNLLLGGGILDPNARIIGSIGVWDFPTQEDFHAYLARDPYRAIWGDVTTESVRLKYFGDEEYEI